jgi:hypothetical protein
MIENDFICFTGLKTHLNPSKGIFNHFQAFLNGLAIA